MRIVSLVPSVTETLSAWDRTPIACTRFCERPDIPHVGGTKNPDVDRIAELEPDLVVVDTEENRREDHDALVERGVPVHVLEVRSLADAVSGHVRAGRPGGRAAGPARSFLRPARRSPGPSSPSGDGRGWPSASPPTVRHLLAHLGIRTVFDADGPYPTVTLAEVTERHPDLVLAPSEPYPFSARQGEELEPVAPTVFLDGKDLFWWGAAYRGRADPPGRRPDRGLTAPLPRDRHGRTPRAGPESDAAR